MEKRARDLLNGPVSRHKLLTSERSRAEQRVGLSEDARRWSPSASLFSCENGSVMKMRSSHWYSGLAAVAVLGLVACGGHMLLQAAKPHHSTRREADCPAGHRLSISTHATPTFSKASTAPKGKTIHPAVAALRNQRLQHYHGRATDVFTGIEGPAYGADLTDLQEDTVRDPLLLKW